MSKLEDSLEKANKIRESLMDNKGRKPDISKTAIKKTADIHINGNNDCIVTISEHNAPIKEEYKKLKSMLIRETKEEFLNTIMISSAVPGEGKSITAINLAISLAQEIDHSILLVDADLRKPKIHEYLGVQFESGLSNYLRQEINISDLLIKTGIGNLVLLPAGQLVDNPVELLSSVKMSNLIKELKQRYMDRYIIIDTPPILSCAEGIAIGSNVDGVIFVVQEGRAQKKTIIDALDLIKDLNILGVVYNNVSAASLNGHYSSYYQHNYHYRKREK